MKNLIEKHKGSVLVFEDSETKELYYQCLCGGIGLYERCLKLSEEETDDFRSGTMDHDQMLRNICSESPEYKHRFIKPI